MFANNTSTSFFDEEGTSFAFKALGPKSQHPSELSSKPTLINPISCRDLSTNIVTKGVYALHKTWLVYYGADITRLPKAAINLAHSQFRTSPKENGSLDASKFIVTKNGTSIELTFSNPSIQNDWAFVLRRICVLTTFHEDYQGLKMIGRGAFARVYMIESKSNKTCFAAKAFTKDYVIHPEKIRAKMALINEINIMRALDHENIIKLHEVHETDKSVYLVMELVKGQTLESLIKKRVFVDDHSGSQSMQMIYSILDSLRYLAEEGIMHRDLKPSNILIQEGGKVKIVDFGMATYINIPKYIFNKCGTPGYIAPEIFKYDQNKESTAYNDRCDVFSAGCILFYMLSGNPLIKGKNVSEIIELNRSTSNNSDAFTQLIKQEFGSYHARANKEGLNLVTKLLEFDHKKRISAKDALKSLYFHSANVKGSALDSVTIPIFERHFQTAGGDSPRIRLHSRDSNNNSVQSEDLSLNAVHPERCIQKESLFLDIGKCEMNGKTDSLSIGSGIHSVLKVNEKLNVSLNNSSFSPTCKKNILLEQKAKGQSKSFRSNAGTPKNNQTVLKAAIFRNMAHTTKHEDEDKKHGGVISFSQMVARSSSENQISFRKGSADGYINGPRNLLDGLDDDNECDIGDEDSNISSEYEKFKESTPKKHTGEVLQKQSGFSNFTPRK